MREKLIVVFYPWLLNFVNGDWMKQLNLDRLRETL